QQAAAAAQARAAPNSSLEPVPSALVAAAAGPNAVQPDLRQAALQQAQAAQASQQQPPGATPRRGIMMLPPVEDEAAHGARKRSVHREAALAMSSALGEDDEYDIPAFLRRNAE